MEKNIWVSHFSHNLFAITSQYLSYIGLVYLLSILAIIGNISLK